MKVGIIGATGYAGAELTRILAMHPEIQEIVLSSQSYEGENIENIYPNFLHKIKGSLKKAEEVVESADLIFAALPSGVGEDYAKACVEKGKLFIDLSADFRFGTDEDLFVEWYGKPYKYPELRKHSVYGLPELNRKAIAKKGAAKIIANPGCYPTAASLGAMPALGFAGTGPIIVDAASGITGGGRDPARAYHFPECSDSLTPYKAGKHRHAPEIARNIAASWASIPRKEVPPQIVFTPHLAPMNRGILATIYIALQYKISEKELHEIYGDFYKDEPFVRVLALGAFAATNRVRLSNFCDISVHLDHSGTMLIVASAIDNMVKGAAGQAVQNMNLALGFPEDAGLSNIPALF